MLGLGMGLGRIFDSRFRGFARVSVTCVAIVRNVDTLGSPCVCSHVLANTWGLRINDPCTC